MAEWEKMNDRNKRKKNGMGMIKCKEAMIMKKKEWNKKDV